MKLPASWKWLLPCLIGGLLVLSGCSGPQATASRVFLNVSVTYLGEYSLPQTTFADTEVGGLSALTYDRSRDRIYALSDDRRQPRFYTLKLNRNPQPLPAFPIDSIDIEAVNFLKDTQGEVIGTNRLDPEGIAITPQQQLVIASEGIESESPPLVVTFDRASGQWQDQLSLPPHYFPTEGSDQGISDNRGFEALTLSPEGDRVFTATELPLRQDVDLEQENPVFYSRFLHYLIGDVRPLFISEHLYPLEPPGLTTGTNGLTELAALDSAGHFLSLERSYSPLTGFGAQLFQIATAGATNTAEIKQLSFPLQRLKPILKQPLFNLNTLPIKLQNLEGMLLGPQLEDGSQLLLLISDNGFQAEQPTQFLAFRLQQP